MRLRIQVDGDQHGDLAGGKIGLPVVYQGKRDIVPEANRLPWAQLHSHPQFRELVSEPKH
jgi:hypothetical protein